MKNLMERLSEEQIAKIFSPNNIKEYPNCMGDLKKELTEHRFLNEMTFLDVDLLISFLSSQEDGSKPLLPYNPTLSEIRGIFKPFE